MRHWSASGGIEGGSSRGIEGGSSRGIDGGSSRGIEVLGVKVIGGLGHGPHAEIIIIARSAARCRSMSLDVDGGSS